ncbi:MAG: hypothetical protein BWX80_03428 [Candidatus Hydrogenedentes bacterium ADurb.Bin101]|jgi:hypothetical protein|nr:MAG: hypothetical protein BWX80_03428 [Candidatus Hydrogenedentes bacterium ADurb.Bin101]
MARPKGQSRRNATKSTLSRNNFRRESRTSCSRDSLVFDVLSVLLSFMSFAISVIQAECLFIIAEALARDSSANCSSAWRLW